MHRQYTEVLELRIFRRLCLQLYIVEKKSAQVGFEPGTFIIVTQRLTHQTNLQHTKVGFEPGTFIIVTQRLTHQTNLQHTRSEKI